MQQVKLFKGVDSEIAELEGQINRWIATEKVQVISIQGNIAPQNAKQTMGGSFSQADLFVIVVYTPSS